MTIEVSKDKPLPGEVFSLLKEAEPFEFA